MIPDVLGYSLSFSFFPIRVSNYLSRNYRFESVLLPKDHPVLTFENITAQRSALCMLAFSVRQSRRFPMKRKRKRRHLIRSLIARTNGRNNFGRLRRIVRRCNGRSASRFLEQRIRKEHACLLYLAKHICGSSESRSHMSSLSARFYYLNSIFTTRHWRIRRVRESARGRPTHEIRLVSCHRSHTQPRL